MTDDVQFEPLDGTPVPPQPISAAAIPGDLERLTDVLVELTVEVGRTRMSLGEALSLGPGSVVTVDRLPKTRSGKILRGTMQKIADGEEWKMPATIDDPAILDEISAALAARNQD